MGLDRFANFISKSINNDGIEEVNIENNVRKVISNHIFFDMNFLIYQEIIEIENEINDIIKTLLCLPFISGDSDILEKQLKTILGLPHWKPYYQNTDLEKIFDGFNEDEIIMRFLSHINSKISSSTNTEGEETGLSIMEMVIYEKITNVMFNFIEQMHHTQFIQTLSLFFDGIPSLSKVIEQRRRRVKNYLESVEKKVLFKKVFDNLDCANQKLENCISKKYNNSNICSELVFDYFKWVKNRFSIDKSIGPSSLFIKNMEQFIKIKTNKLFPQSSIYFNSPSINGESDLKIFKYISSEEIIGDCCIHTTDSDLIHQILVQQSYYKIINKDVNFTVVKYLKNINSIGFAQIIEANQVIKNIIDLYSTVNNYKTNNFKIIWDLCFIFFMFGNDHLPSSLEIGPELGLEYYLKKHYQALGKNNMINIKKSYMTLDLANLSLFLMKINETNEINITRIILQRFFKININLINLFTDKLNMDFNKIITILQTYILYKSLQLSETEYNNLDHNDLRYILRQNVTNLDIYKSNECFCLDETKIKLIIESDKLFEENLDYCEPDYMGLVLYTKPQNTTNDSYQDLYNYVVEKANTNLLKTQPKYYDHIELTNHLAYIKQNNIYDENVIDDYLKKIYHLMITQFGSMKDYHSDNITFYKHYQVPCIKDICSYIDSLQDKSEKVKQWLSIIKNDNLKPEQYLNSINHHLLITPFINAYVLPKNLKDIIENIDLIDNLWLDSNISSVFNYRDIDFKKYIHVWNEVLIKINLISKSDKINDELINVNINFV